MSKNSSSDSRSGTKRPNFKAPNGNKCHEYGEIGHYAMDRKNKIASQKQDSYEVKYKRLVASFNKYNIGSKVLLADEEKCGWRGLI